MSLRARLMIWNVLAVLTITVLLGAAVSWKVREALTAGVDRELRDRAERRVGIMRARGQGPPEMRMPPGEGQGPGGPPLGRGPQMLPPDLQPGQVPIAQGPFRPRVFDRQLQSASQFQQDKPWDADAARKAFENRPLLTTVQAEGERQRVFSIVLDGPNGERVFQYAHPLSETERSIAGVNQTLFGMLPFALFLAGLGGYYLTDRALKPVGALAGAAEKISGENLTSRLPIHGQDEFAQLARTVNSMLDRLETAFRKEQRFTGDAAHELRSPLTAIKANASLALTAERGKEEYRDTIVEIDRSATRMAELIDDLLLLARSDAGGLTFESEPLDLEAAVQEAARSVGPRTPVLEIEAGAMPSANRKAIVRLFANLLSNAFRHTPEAGQVLVRASREAGRVNVEVEDTGEGIGSEHLSHLGERFYRVDSARARATGGVGLGLAICKSIVEAHGGRLRIESVRGKGTTVVFDLPAA